jgi:hypothetical protein
LKNIFIKERAGRSMSLSLKMREPRHTLERRQNNSVGYIEHVLSS